MTGFDRDVEERLEQLESERSRRVGTVTFTHIHVDTSGRVVEQRPSFDAESEPPTPERVVTHMTTPPPGLATELAERRTDGDSPVVDDYVALPPEHADERDELFAAVEALVADRGLVLEDGVAVPVDGADAEDEVSR